MTYDLTPDRLRELANEQIEQRRQNEKLVAQFDSDTLSHKLYRLRAEQCSDSETALRELAAIKGAAGKGVTDEVVDIFVQKFVGCPIDPSDRKAIQRALEAVAPMLAVQHLGRQWYLYYDDSPMAHCMKASITPIMDTESGKYIRVREILDKSPLPPPLQQDKT